MSGVIDKDGTQWEHCNECGKMFRIETLWYELPTEQYSCGRDLCRRCAIRSSATVQPPTGSTFKVVAMLKVS